MLRGPTKTRARKGLALIGRRDVGGSIARVHNPLDLVELEIEEGGYLGADAGFLSALPD